MKPKNNTLKRWTFQVTDTNDSVYDSSDRVSLAELVRLSRTKSQTVGTLQTILSCQVAQRLSTLESGFSPSCNTVGIVDQVMVMVLVGNRRGLLCL